MVSPAFLCRIPRGLFRDAENQRDSQELVIYLIDIGGQGRNRTTDTRIFSSYFYVENLHYSAVNLYSVHVEDRNDYSLRLALRPLPRPACTSRLAF
jgi:hypothetical protein